MATYNLAHRNAIPLDVPFLLSLSDKTLPLIEEHQEVLSNTTVLIPVSGDYSDAAPLTTRQLFEQRKRDFLSEQKKYSWLSWNRTDAYVKDHLTPATITSSLNK